MQGDVELQASGAYGKYGRLLVRAPNLKKQLIDKGLAKATKGKRAKWCD